MTDDIFLAQILGHKLLGGPMQRSVWQNEGFLCSGRLKLPPRQLDKAAPKSLEPAANIITTAPSTNAFSTF
jgi:hypothetical protein